MSNLEKPLTWDEALAVIDELPLSPALLLANGFSIAWDKRFRYNFLLDAIDLPTKLKRVFKHYGTSDFELVMRALDDARTVAEIYGVPSEYGRRMKQHQSGLREALVRAIQVLHPSDASELTAAAIAACTDFLSPFSSIFTTNYDLLLYWVVNTPALKDRFRDGFAWNDNRTHLVWRRPESQNTFYLHGALHFAKLDIDKVEKFTWSGLGEPILSHVEKLIEDGGLPLIVTEGRHTQKVEHVSGIAYLTHCFEELMNLDVPLFLYGFGFGDQDSHITKAIVRSKCPIIFVGLFGNGRGRVKDAIDAMVRERKKRGGPELTAAYVESSTADPWGKANR